MSDENLELTEQEKLKLAEEERLRLEEEEKIRLEEEKIYELEALGILRSSQVHGSIVHRSLVLQNQPSL